MAIEPGDWYSPGTPPWILPYIFIADEALREILAASLVLQTTTRLKSRFATDIARAAIAVIDERTAELPARFGAAAGKSRSEKA